MDRLRTTLNVTGDGVVCGMVSAITTLEDEPLDEIEKHAPSVEELSSFEESDNEDSAKIDPQDPQEVAC